MPRSSAAEAEQTRRAILAETVQQMSVHGAGGISLGGIATTLNMSKAGVVGPFRTREALLLAAFDLGVAALRERVIDPALVLHLGPGEQRLRVIVEGWTDYLVNSPFRGGCLLTSASFELDGQSGPLRDHMVEAARQWRHFLRAQLSEAVAAGHRLPHDVPDTAALLIALGLSLNQAVQLDDADTRDRTIRLLRETAGL
ncbi:TetR/AcrR family transcriptional regulator [Kineosporia mesophila]|nr:TetR family transcriptional regulator C-terminal domain-containing protein [Kineosporia mesophila]MCD5354705.1 TetR family transcriptional regulator C-terminal domain-containing protein [Kineosporia mesophila]